MNILSVSRDLLSSAQWFTPLLLLRFNPFAVVWNHLPGFTWYNVKTLFHIEAHWMFCAPWTDADYYSEFIFLFLCNHIMYSYIKAAQVLVAMLGEIKAEEMLYEPPPWESMIRRKGAGFPTFAAMKWTFSHHSSQIINFRGEQSLWDAEDSNRTPHEVALNYIPSNYVQMCSTQLNPDSPVYLKFSNPQKRVIDPVIGGPAADCHSEVQPLASWLEMHLTRWGKASIN